MKKENQIANCRKLVKSIDDDIREGKFTGGEYYFYKIEIEYMNTFYLVKDDDEKEIRIDEDEFNYYFQRLTSFVSELDEWDLMQIKKALTAMECFSDDDQRKRRLHRLINKFKNSFDEIWSNMRTHDF